MPWGVNAAVIELTGLGLAAVLLSAMAGLLLFLILMNTWQERQSKLESESGPGVLCTECCKRIPPDGKRVQVRTEPDGVPASLCANCEHLAGQGRLFLPNSLDHFAWYRFLRKLHVFAGRSRLTACDSMERAKVDRAAFLRDATDFGRTLLMRLENQLSAMQAWRVAAKEILKKYGLVRYLGPSEVSTILPA